MPQWRRTLYTLWITRFIAVAGFSFATPFVPYYVQELGVTDLRQVGQWAGLVTSAQAVSMALVAPMWGALADRYGRKLMVLRATFGGVSILALMGFVVNVQQLTVLATNTAPVECSIRPARAAMPSHGFSGRGL